MTINIENEIENGLDFDYEELINKVINQAIDYTEFPFEAEINVVDNKNDPLPSDGQKSLPCRESVPCPG